MIRNPAAASPGPDKADPVATVMARLDAIDSEVAGLVARHVPGLPEALRLRPSGRMVSRLGHYSPDRHEIALNVRLLAFGSDSEVREVVLHELAHVLAHHRNGSRGRVRPHGREFASACRELGIEPSRLIDADTEQWGLRSRRMGRPGNTRKARALRPVEQILSRFGPGRRPPLPTGDGEGPCAEPDRSKGESAAGGPFGDPGDMPRAPRRTYAFQFQCPECNQTLVRRRMGIARCPCGARLHVRRAPQAADNSAGNPDPVGGDDPPPSRQGRLWR